MKKQGILNSSIARVLANMGHTDTICIGDCGLPIPDGVERIDLAVKFGTPAFLEVLEEVLNDMKVESAILAAEIEEYNKNLSNDLKSLTEKLETGFMISHVPHEEFKKLTRNCKAVIRTGEVKPYANIILQSGNIFG